MHACACYLSAKTLAVLHLLAVLGGDLETLAAPPKSAATSPPNPPPAMAVPSSPSPAAPS
jgi:hypothetical protein